MNKNRIFLIVQSVLCVILAVLLAAAAIGICGEGLALKAADPLHGIFTREKAAAALVPVWPLLAVSLGLTITGLFLGVGDRNADKPSRFRPENKKEQTKPLARKTRQLRIALLILAAVLIIAGVFNGSAKDVFGKAVKICTECVGLG